jgi:hypothetical protein
MRQIDRELLISALFIVIGAAIYLHPLKHREPARMRVSISFAIAIAASVLTELVFGKSLLEGYLKLVCWLLIITIMICVCAQCSKNAAIYVAIWSVITAQFIYELWFVITGIINDFADQWNNRWLILILFYSLIYLIVRFTLARKMPTKGSYDIGPRQLSSAAALMVVFEILYFSVINSSLRGQEDKLWLPIVSAQCYCITILYLQTELFKKSAIEKELFTMNLLWQQKKSQYDLAKENIDLINRKCHDLKHQIAAIRGVADEESKEKYLSEVEASVHFYEAIVKTGNEVLDTILTDKSLYCEANGIKINCVVDGSKLSFMDPVDLYTVLGNAIDNAIESVSDFKEPEKRLIDISIYNRQKFLVMSISNPVEGEIKFRDGLPISIKPNNGYHGFGLMSIKHNVKKYEGYMNVDVENHCFVLKILIPLQDNK